MNHVWIHTSIRRLKKYNETLLMGWNKGENYFLLLFVLLVYLEHVHPYHPFAFEVVLECHTFPFTPISR